MSAIDKIVYAPLGFGLSIKDAAPELLATWAARGRAEVEARQEALSRHVVTVRSHGQVAWAFGVPKLQARVQSRLDDLVERVTGANPPPAPAPEPAVAAVPDPEPNPTPDFGGAGLVSTTIPRPQNGSSAVPDDARGADLPIPGYDALSASQVVERLLGLAPDELEAVRSYEATHRNRRTILGKIEQLAS